MKTLSVLQGSPEWLAVRLNHDTASEAPAAAGQSKYLSRTQLLHQKKTGLSEEIDDFKQGLFDKGHESESGARPLAEKIINDDLYPITATLHVDGIDLLASFDGCTLDEEIIFEHKLWSESLAADVKSGTLHPHYTIQMDQQLLVSGAKKCLFMTSDGTEENMAWCWYESSQSKFSDVISTWKQFNIDLAEYVPVEVLPAAVAAPTLNLPAVMVKVEGSIALISNLDVFGDALRGFISKIPENPSTDQEFADCEDAVKKLQAAQDALDAAEANAMGQIASFDEMKRTKTLLWDLTRTTRLAVAKLVADRKLSIKAEKVQTGKDKLAEHIAALNKRLGKPYMPPIVADWAGAIKSLRTMASLQNAIDTMLSQKKIEASEAADRIELNLNSLRELAANHTFLFSDTPAIIGKANDDLISLIKSRIADHAAAEAKRIEAETARIREEERIKAEAKAKTDADAKAKADADAAAKAQAEQDAALKAEADRLASLSVKVADVAPQSSSAPRAGMEPGKAPEAYQFPAHTVSHSPIAAPTLTLGKIGARIAPLSITADGLRQLGFEPAGRERAAVLYHEDDWQAICAALLNHIDHARSHLQQAA